MGTAGIILVVLAVPAVVTAAWLLYAYARFKQTPEAAWRDHVLNTADIFRERLRALQDEIHAAKDRRSDEVERERIKALERYLATISVNVLQEFPGIGPVTVENLRKAGMTNLSRVPANLQRVPGLGPKRAQDVRAAINLAVGDALSRFDAEGCREAQEWKERTRLVEAAIARQIADAEDGIRLARHALTHLEPYVAIARRVTLFGYVRKRRVDGLTPQLLDVLVEKFIPPLPAGPAPAPRPAAPLPVPVPSAATGDAAAPAPAGPAVLPDAPARPTPPEPADLFRALIESTNAAPAPMPEHPRLPHLRAVVRLGVAIARADGRVANAERDVIRRYLQEYFGHEPELNRRIHPLMEQAEKESPNLDEALTAARGLFTGEELMGLFRLAGRVADAGGKRNAKKDACLRRVAEAWGIKESKPAAPPPPAPQPAPGRDEAVAALEIAAGVPLTGDLVRRQYRLLSERFDPAKFESHGADFVSVARGKLEKVEQAAKLLIEQLGEKLEEETKPEPPKDLRHNPDLDAVFGM